MKISQRTSLASLVATAAVLLTAGGAGAQVASQETYQLAQVAGQALPVVTEENGDCRDELSAATLTLDTDGTWTLVTTEREVCGQDVDEDEDREDGRYTVDGQTIHFTDDDGNVATADGDDSELEVDDLVHATRTADGLTVQVADGDTQLQFRR